ncbi:MAG: hypothetical protein BWK73_05820 [Thiothrix lacustris]|uniref:Uncharacterized protein n=1 Tax=Thiothrix lacustris TaxID=525917 RepID=A0A1Y1QWZ3_9GAMM|nr:MAG: hypothetical protein BWK73_05820 [Thiothrix lacustris]
MSNPLLTPQEQARIDTVRSYQHSPDTYPTPTASNAMEALTAFLARVDWNLVFQVTARVLVSIGMLFTAYQYLQYTLFFGAGALAFIGQFLIGVFFVAVVFMTSDDLHIMTAALGMYLLANSF